jgi:hypothetical protein
MNSPATARPPRRSRWALIVAGVLALLGSLVVTAPAQAGYYGESYYGSSPCSYRCGYSPYRYAPRYDYHGCSACGCYRRCYSRSRPGLVYERRYVEREYVERRYGWPTRHYRRHYGYYPYGGYRSWSRPFPWGYGGVRRWGYGGVRGWRTPYGYRYEPSSYRYEGAPRPPAPVWGGSGYETVPYGYERAGWNGGPSGPEDPALQASVAPYGAEDVSQPFPRGPLGMLASGLVGILNLGAP